MEDDNYYWFLEGLQKGFSSEYIGSPFHVFNSKNFNDYSIDKFKELEDCDDYYSSGFAYGVLYCQDRRHQPEHIRNMFIP